MNIKQLAKSDYLKLLPILALAFYIAFIPHLNYPYPLHLDEWNKLALSEALINAGGIYYPDPWVGGEPLPYPHVEVGFHVLYSAFHQISGLSWLFIFRYFPSIIFMLTVVSVYILARRRGFGWQAALLTCLIPTSVGVLGPAFLVPVATALPFIPLSLFLVFNFQNKWSYILLSAFTCFLLTIHSVSAVILIIVLAPYILLNIKANFRHSLGIIMAVFIPLLIPFPWIFSIIIPMAKSLMIQVMPRDYVAYPEIIQDYGYIPIVLALVGVLFLGIRGGKENYSLILGLSALLAMLVTFYTFHYGIHVLYERGLVYTMLLMSIFAGAGLAGMRQITLPAAFGSRLKIPPIITQNAGNILCLVLIVLTLAMVIPARQNAEYYHMIDSEDYQAFVWIKENVAGNYELAILDPWKATAFTAITGKHVYSRIGAFPDSKDSEVREFLWEGCQDTLYLKKRGISIVYTRSNCYNEELTEVRKYVYLLEQ